MARGTRRPAALTRILLAASAAALLAVVLAPASARAANPTYTVPVDYCATYIIDQTPLGSPWSIHASTAFLGIVSDPLVGVYYGPSVGSSHSGNTGSTYDNFYSACNICSSAPLDVTFAVAGRITPSSAIQGIPNPGVEPASSITSVDVLSYKSQCGFAGTFGELDAFPAMASPVLGPALVVIAFLILLLVVLPTPAAAAVPAVAAPAPPAPSWTPAPQAPPPRPAGPAYTPSQEWTTGGEPSPPEAGAPVGGAGITVGPPVVAPPPTPPSHFQDLRPSCPRCHGPTVPAYGRWHCPRCAWYPWG